MSSFSSCLYIVYKCKKNQQPKVKDFSCVSLIYVIIASPIYIYLILHISIEYEGKSPVYIPKTI